MNGPARPSSARDRAALAGTAAAPTVLASFLASALVFALAAVMACASIAGRHGAGTRHTPRPAGIPPMPFAAGAPPVVTASVAPEAFASFGLGLHADGDGDGSGDGRDAGPSAPAVRLSAR